MYENSYITSKNRFSYVLQGFAEKYMNEKVYRVTRK